MVEAYFYYSPAAAGFAADLWQTVFNCRERMMEKRT